MEYWIKKGKEAIQLPVKPASFQVSFENSHQTVNIQTRGDVSILGKKGLETFALESFFPAHDYPFADYKKDRSPWDYVTKLRSWQESVVQLVITKTKVNKKVIFKSFSYGEEDGSGDIKYSLTLETYRQPKYTKPVKATLEPVNPVKKKPVKKNNRSDNKKMSKVHTVGGNDTLWSLAKKYYGSGTYYTKIYNVNKTIIEKTARQHGLVSSAHNGVYGWWIYDGTKLVIP